VIVAGAAGAQGNATARLLAEHGAKLILADSAEDRLLLVRDAVLTAGGTADAKTVDSANSKGWEELVALAVERHGALHGLVNFAAVLSRAGVEQTTLEAWEHTIQVNQTGAWLAMRAAVPAMRAAGGGAIVNIGSIDALVGRGGATAYQASKGGLRLLSKSAAIELASANIRVNTVHPGPMADRMSEIVGPQTNAADTVRLEETLRAQIPLGRLGLPLDIAYAVRYLLCDEAAFVTGVDLPVDGGLTAQ
jgi:3alpha(or 20beta)-hydroxysteroid dehydrogenase